MAPPRAERRANTVLRNLTTLHYVQFFSLVRYTFSISIYRLQILYTVQYSCIRTVQYSSILTGTLWVWPGGVRIPGIYLPMRDAHGGWRVGVARGRAHRTPKFESIYKP